LARRVFFEKAATTAPGRKILKKLKKKVLTFHRVPN